MRPGDRGYGEEREREKRGSHCGRGRKEGMQCNVLNAGRTVRYTLCRCVKKIRARASLSLCWSAVCWFRASRRAPFDSRSAACGLGGGLSLSMYALYARG